MSGAAATIASKHGQPFAFLSERVILTFWLTL